MRCYPIRNVFISIIIMAAVVTVMIVFLFIAFQATVKPLYALSLASNDTPPATSTWDVTERRLREDVLRKTNSSCNLFLTIPPPLSTSRTSGAAHPG